MSGQVAPEGAIRHFARAGVYIIRYRFLESPVSPEIKDLWKLGFFFRNERRHTLGQVRGPRTTQDGSRFRQLVIQRR